MSWNLDGSTGVTKAKEPSRASTFRFVTVDGKGAGVNSTGMIDVIAASTKRSLRPRIQYVEHQWRIDGNRRMKTARRLPCSIPHTTNELALSSRCMQRHAPSVAGDDVSVWNDSGNVNL